MQCVNVNTHCEYNVNTQQGLRSHITKKHRAKQDLENLDDNSDTTNKNDGTEVVTKQNENTINSEKRTYVLNSINTVNKKIECSKRIPVKILDKTTSGADKVNNATMTMEFNLGVFEYLWVFWGEMCKIGDTIEHGGYW